MCARGHFAGRQSDFSHQGAFPYDHHAPAVLKEKVDISLISLAVCLELFRPELAARLGNR
jgi:hypothetical protein